VEDDLGLTDDQINSLIDEQPTNEVMPETAPKEEAAPTENQFAFTARGKEVSPKDLDQLKGYASKGYDYAQLIADHKTKEEAFQQKQTEFEEKSKLYQDIDSYANQNPDWWNHVNEQFQNRANLQAAPPEQGEQQVNPEIEELKGQISEFKAFKDQLVREQETMKQQKEDQALKQEIQSIQDHYLEHAQKIGTDSFRAAFRDFYHENLLKQAETRGKETVSKEIQRNKQLGLLGESPAPLQKLKQETNPKNLSYDELEKQAMAELGIA
jgi:hypothetical protein